MNKPRLLIYLGLGNLRSAYVFLIEENNMASQLSENLVLLFFSYFKALDDRNHLRNAKNCPKMILGQGINGKNLKLTRARFIAHLPQDDHFYWHQNA